ncbi:hypothetical protein AG1IA_02341 [Rhizoctonia solani AG-1 IA]|uniref:Uncharacterized protein n=1 Tax=Thanatephorus cucumeris (strain AG1-IA) TaxID=983506 RepID=L8X4R7_THACA|nr:hypothetical protein AG1IA_02341 [Rhizoctonia solani AG-1 IA]
MDFYVVMGRPGARVARRKQKTGTIGFTHRVKKEDTMSWFKQRFDGIILSSFALFPIRHHVFVYMPCRYAIHVTSVTFLKVAPSRRLVSTPVHILKKKLKKGPERDNRNEKLTK